MQLLQQIADGVSAGSIYAALALALVLVYRATGLVNFAQGQMAVVSVYLAWSFLDAGLPTAAAVLLTLAASVVIGAVTERVLIRRFERRDPLIAIIVTVGILTFGNGLIVYAWGAELKPFASVFGGHAFAVGHVRFTANDLGTVAVLIGVVLALQALFRWTRLGLAMRAVADEPESSALCGLPIGKLLMAGWGLAALVGAIAGILIAPKVSLQPDMLDTVLVYALAAAVLGGLDSPLGAVLAAWLLGIAQNLAGAYVGFIGNDLDIAVPLAIMVAVLLVRPQGLFGRREVERV
jgi:branched-chain amino acid transport system permease protein